MNIVIRYINIKAITNTGSFNIGTTLNYVTKTSESEGDSGSPPSEPSPETPPQPDVPFDKPIRPDVPMDRPVRPDVPRV
ncbi:hypothetical protein IC620_15770 [Hazenella sp. IB182357]|uniref:Uncharacterized protein n=1 Tax=Polycladospora coralii TaxID=2771432 RepID=A0A926RVG7_9BACL|nr:hypothetical protein [Polycladospora coralii]MBD1373802.1 hypothetical protein [Polycladospora coralii]MBS7531546.1 hypothetical protein [Polycladospora coralii]